MKIPRGLQLLPLVVALLATISCIHTSAAKFRRGTAPGQVCMTPTWYGITLGTTSDSTVVSLHGQGLYRSDGDGRWRRYYHDRTRSVLMVSHADLNGTVNSLTISFQQDTAARKSNDIGVSQKLSAAKGIGDTKLHLGSSREETRKVLGEGKEVENTTVWSYDVTCQDSPSGHPVELILIFEEERIVSASFSERPTS